MERSQNCSTRPPKTHRPAVRTVRSRLGFLGLLAGPLLCFAACTTNTPGSSHHGPTLVPQPDDGSTTTATSPLQISLLQKKLDATTPARPLPPSDAQTRLSAAIDQYFQRAATRRFYVHVDKPIYQPGETVWLRIWELTSASLTMDQSGHGIRVELISPKGASVIQKRVQVTGGIATNDLSLPATVQGGEYIIRAMSDLGGTVERTIVVSQYQPPRIKKKLEFLRKAYGPGDKVAAALALHRATGEPLAGQAATAIVTIDEREVARMPLRVSATGTGVVKFDLPASIARGDGLLTVLVADGGVTESIQKRIPIVMREMQVELFPEGGDLIVGLPGRVYFMAKNLLGKPADIEGRVVDDTGAQVARFGSLHNGLGRFELTPVAERAYFVEITKPVGIKQRIPLPSAQKTGCSLMAVDDPDNRRDDVRVAVWCTQPQTVIATAVLRERRMGQVSLEGNPESPTVVSLPVPVGSQGAVRVTVLDEALQPMAERLIYRGRGQNLKVAITGHRSSYAPRDQVELSIVTKDLAGKPVAADLALAVVDDTVLGFADDKKAHMLARLYLESEMPGQEIEEPKFYFSKDAKAAHALDLVLGTQGWRRFEWQQVLAPVTVVARSLDTSTEDPVPLAVEAEELEGGDRRPRMPRKPQAKKPRDKKPQIAKPPAKEVEKKIMVAKMGKRRPAKDRAKGELKAQVRGKARGPRVRDRMVRAAGEIRPMMEKRNADGDWADGDDELQANRWSWAPVRVFPAPNYQARYDGPRVDFRETIFWQPSVQTDQSGQAKVTFYLSDAVTSFRATAEGISTGGLPGRGDALITSKLPVSLAVKMPLEVSRRDRVKLPVTLSNETERKYEVAIATQFGAAFKVSGGIPAKISLAPGERKSFFAQLEVIGDGKDPAAGKAVVSIETANLRDEVARDIRVVPLGFPQDISIAGNLDGTQSHELNLAGALPGTIEASLNLYPSPLATMVKGTEALIREPTGCFEQASSANYPNIMILAYLEENDSADPAVVERAMGMLDRGYKKLTGYESPKRGYEWFGGNPGHEALTAYGLMEFADMTKVYGDVDAGMVKRTAGWLKSRRDGKGGYQRNKRALDSFGRASPEVTNGYISYALSEAGQTDMAQELAYQQTMAKQTKDPYLMALAANVLVNLKPGSAGSALDRLQGMQKPDGSFAGADHSITRSGGQALIVETTALAIMALTKAERAHSEPVRKAVGWLNQNRSGYGGFGSTQSTILALRALTSYASATRATQDGGVVSVLVNGKQAGQVRFEKGHKGALVVDDIASLLNQGGNRIELRLDSKIALPYSLAVSYRSAKPASSKQTQVAVTTRLSQTKVPMGEGVRMKVKVENLTDKGLPMTLARIGIPGGLTFQNWQLDELKDKGLIGFYETREREVVLYFRAMAPKAVKNIDLDLLARVPGQYVAPASRAYLYYTDEFKHWVAPVRVTVE